MKWLQAAGLLIALFLIYFVDILDYVVQSGVFGYSTVETGTNEGLTILFWSTVVFLFFFFKFRTWAQTPPLKFAQTPPRHFTTNSRFLLAQFWYVGCMVGVFFVLISSPQLYDEISVLFKGFLGSASPVVKAFDDPQILGTQGGDGLSFHTLGRAEAAPYTAFFLIMVFSRFNILQEPAIRNFFQKSALIPMAAIQQNEILHDSKTQFVAHQEVLDHLGERSLKGLVNVTTYRSDPHLQNIVMTEYLNEQIRRQNDKHFDTAICNSNYPEVRARIKQVNDGLRKLVEDGAELVRVIESKELSKLQSWQAKTKSLMHNVVGQSKRLVRVAGQSAEREVLVILDRLKEEVKELDSMFVKSSVFLESARNLYLINDGCVLGFELFREELDTFADEVDQVLTLWPLDSLTQTATVQSEDFSAIRKEIAPLSKTSTELSKSIEKEIGRKQEESMSLSWIHQYQRQLHGDNQRVFNWAFATRQKEVLEEYRKLHEDVSLLMTTLVLAGDKSAKARVGRFNKIGFKLDEESAAIPPYMLRISFFAVLFICLLISFSYLFFTETYQLVSQHVFNSGFFTERDLVRDISNNIQLKTPGDAWRWSVIGAFMQMLAILIALMAWSLSPEYHTGDDSKKTVFRQYTGACYNGLVFGFFANVVLFFVLGLIFQDLNLLRENWQWTLIGGVTGAFLLIQGLNVRERLWRAVAITSVSQGLITGLVAGCIAWTWGYQQVRPEYLGPFILYAWLNMTAVGLVVGMLARFFMVNEYLRPKEVAFESEEVAGASDAFASQQT